MKAPSTRAVCSTWKQFTWNDLDRLRTPENTLVSLKHNSFEKFEGVTKNGVSLKSLLLSLMQKGKREANSRITGFIKTVENTRVNGEWLPNIITRTLVPMEEERNTSRNPFLLQAPRDTPRNGTYFARSGREV